LEDVEHFLESMKLYFISTFMTLHPSLCTMLAQSLSEVISSQGCQEIITRTSTSRFRGASFISLSGRRLLSSGWWRKRPVRRRPGL
jgi:hypothetical protein